jgi:hypothetical protein
MVERMDGLLPRIEIRVFGRASVRLRGQRKLTCLFYLDSLLGRRQDSDEKGPPMWEVSFFEPGGGQTYAGSVRATDAV